MPKTIKFGRVTTFFYLRSSVKNELRPKYNIVVK
jgi:hypothetical protein